MQPFLRAAAFAAACVCADAFGSNDVVSPSPPAIPPPPPPDPAKTCASKELALIDFSGGYVLFTRHPINGTYVGTVNEDGMPHGLGTLTVTGASIEKLIGISYVGDFVDGLFDGLGTMQAPRNLNQITTGSWKAGKKHGQVSTRLIGDDEASPMPCGRADAIVGQHKNNIEDGIGTTLQVKPCQSKVQMYTGRLLNKQSMGSRVLQGDVVAETGFVGGFGTWSWTNAHNLSVAYTTLDVDFIFDTTYEGNWVTSFEGGLIYFLGPGTYTIAAEPVDGEKIAPEFHGAIFAGTWFRKGPFTGYNASAGDMDCVAGTMEKEGTKESGTWCQHTPAGAPQYFTKEKESIDGHELRKLSGGSSGGGSWGLKVAGTVHAAM